MIQHATLDTTKDKALASQAQRPMRIVLVDDEPSILKALQRLLRREPYELITTTSANEVLKIMEQDPADLIVSDQRMPEMTGTDLLSQVRERWPQTIRIILSGYSEVQSILGAVNEGAIYKYLTKPWNDDELKLHIRRAVEQAELIKENYRLSEQIAYQNEQLRSLSLRLLEKAEDAIFGMSFTQDMMNILSAGVINVGSDGLITGINERACELLGVQNGALQSEDANRVLPQQLLNLLETHNQSDTDEYCTQIELGDKQIQICSRRFSVGKENRGQVFTIWEPLS